MSEVDMHALEQRAGQFLGTATAPSVPRNTVGLLPSGPGPIPMTKSSIRSSNRTGWTP